MMTRRAGITTVILALLGWCLLGCGITPQDHPQPREGPPSESASPTGGTSTSSSTPSGRAVIYMLRAGRLLPVDRPGGDLSTALSALLKGPTTAELDAGIRTALPATGTAIAADLDGPVARLRLPPEFTRLDGAQQALAVAQLVYTITEQPHRATAVRLLQGTRELPAPTATGELVSRPVTRADYTLIAPH